MMYYDFFENDFGMIFVVVKNGFVLRIFLCYDDFIDFERICKNSIERNEKKCKFVIKELMEYFRGERTKFTVEYEIDGTEFQKNVMKEVSLIEYGNAISYKDIAQKVKKPNAARAVGNVNRNNKIPIIIPCHRVIKSDGTLGGYAGKFKSKTKLKLLKLERCDLFDKSYTF